MHAEHDEESPPYASATDEAAVACSMGREGDVVHDATILTFTVEYKQAGGRDEETLPPTRTRDKGGGAHEASMLAFTTELGHTDNSIDKYCRRS